MAPRTAPKKSNRSTLGPTEAAALPIPESISDEQRKAQEEEEDWNKRLKSAYVKFKLLKKRQDIVERSRRAVYEYIPEITRKNIELAKQGNCSAAKFLMQLAGIDQIPALVESGTKRSKRAGVDSTDDPMRVVRLFSEKLGMPFPKLKPPKELQAAPEQSPEVPPTL